MSTRSGLCVASRTPIPHGQHHQDVSKGCELKDSKSLGGCHVVLCGFEVNVEDSSLDQLADNVGAHVDMLDLVVGPKCLEQLGTALVVAINFDG